MKTQGSCRVNFNFSGYTIPPTQYLPSVYTLLTCSRPGRHSKTTKFAGPQQFILFVLTQPTYFPIFLLVPEMFDRKRMYIRLAIVSFESFRQDLRRKVVQDFKTLFPDSDELLAFEMIYLLQEGPMPEEHKSRLAKIRPSMLFYNLCRYANLYYLCVPQESEYFLLQQLRIGAISRTVNDWTSIFYLKTKRYQLILDYLANTHTYFEHLSERNLISAFYHLMLNQVPKAVDIIKAAEAKAKDCHQQLLLLLLYSRLGWVDKAIMLGQSLAQKSQYRMIYRILIRLIILINYDKLGQPILKTVQEIAELFEEFRVRVDFFQERFTILLFMSQFCYKKNCHGLIIQGRYFVQKMQEVINTLSVYSQIGASRFIERIKVDQRISIEEELFAPY